MVSQNVHKIDRGLRVLIGLILVSFAFIGPENKWFLLALIPLAVGLFGWCPVYTLLGINTCKWNKSTDKK